MIRVTFYSRLYVLEVCQVAFDIIHFGKALIDTLLNIISGFL